MAQTGTVHLGFKVRVHEGVSYVCVQAPLLWCTVVDSGTHNLKTPWFPVPSLAILGTGNRCHLPVGSAIQPCSIQSHKAQIATIVARDVKQFIDIMIVNMRFVLLVLLTSLIYKLLMSNLFYSYHDCRGETILSDYSYIPSVVFSSPHVAKVGLDEDVAVETYGDVRVYSNTFR